MRPNKGRPQAFAPTPSQDERRMTDIYIVAGARTAIGTLGGTLKDHSPTKLGVVAA